MLQEPTRRIRFLTREEAQRLLDELPEHLADMSAFTLATGLRRRLRLRHTPADHVLPFSQRWRRPR